MKVMLVNSSPKQDGCTATALGIVADSLREEGIETEILWLGKGPVADCIDCRQCGKTGKCVFSDIAAEIGERAAEFDGFVFGSPVYYAHPTGRWLSVMDRAFFAYGRNFKFKPAAAILSARRNGQVASMDVVNKHFSISSMPIVTANYWNHVFGAKAEEVAEDEEGVQTMKNIGKNMAWMLKCIELGRQNGIDHPADVKKVTNFTRQ